MKKAVLLFLLVLGFMVIYQAKAAEFLSGKKSENGLVSISSSEVHKNLYIAGANVTVNSNVLGDLYAAGANISIAGTVEKDLNAVGSTVNVNNQVNGNARLAGGNISLNYPIKGDLLTAGGFINISEKASIGGDLLAAGGNITIDAPVSGYVKIAGGNVLINNMVSGEVFVETKAKNGSLTFGPNAKVLGKITYKGQNPAIIKDGAKVSSIQFTKVAPINSANGFKALFGFGLIIKFFGLLLTAYIAVRLFNPQVLEATNVANQNPWANLGIGLLVLIATPIVALLLFATLIGYYFALILLSLFAVACLISTIFSILIVGSWIMKLVYKQATFTANWKTVIAGLIALTIAALIPLIGWLLCFLVYLVSLGTLIRMYWQKIHNPQVKIDTQPLPF
jgi:hypothetical protein